MAVYMLCLATPLGNERHQASHYTGFAVNVDARLKHHRSGNKARSSAFTAAAVERGIEMRVARVWEDGDRGVERRIKNRKEARSLCPLCSGPAALKRGQYHPESH